MIYPDDEWKDRNEFAQERLNHAYPVHAQEKANRTRAKRLTTKDAKDTKVH
jgi:hypothetical protein